MSEVNNLRQKVSIVETELSNNTVKLNASENAKKSLEDKLKKAEEQVKKLESSKVCMRLLHFPCHDYLLAPCLCLCLCIFIIQKAELKDNQRHIFAVTIEFSSFLDEDKHF